MIMMVSSVTRGRGGFQTPSLAGKSFFSSLAEMLVVIFQGRFYTSNLNRLEERAEERSPTDVCLGKISMAPTPTIKITDSASPYYWGIDIGGTGIKLGLVDDGGQTVAFKKLPTRESEGPESAMNQIGQATEQMEQELGVVGQVPHIGLGAPGPMDLDKGLLIEPPQLPSWWGFPIVSALEKRLGRPGGLPQ